MISYIGRKSGNRISTSSKGFSLIELVAVIMIMGVLATAISQYVIFGTEVYVSSNLRQKTLSESRFLVERLSRELRGAVPYSIRISGFAPFLECIEFVPIKASGAYRTDDAAEVPPISPNPDNDIIDVISWSSNEYNQNDRMFIYATESSHIYGTSDRMNQIDSITETADPQFQIGFSSDVSFAEGSPINRYFTADHSISYCLINVSSDGTSNMYRFVNTSFAAIQPIPLTAVGFASGVLMAEGIKNDLSTESPFEYENAVLTQNSVVSLYFEFEADEGENMFYNHEVHIPNVP